jgi:hypothetical protein
MTTFHGNPEGEQKDKGAWRHKVLRLQHQPMNDGKMRYDILNLNPVKSQI